MNMNNYIDLETFFNMTKNSKTAYNFWRPSWEAIAGIFWISAAVIFLTIGRLKTGGIANIGILAIPMAYFGYRRCLDAVKLWHFKALLNVERSSSTALSTVIAQKKLHPESIWIGRGFEWDHIHADRIKKITRLDKAELDPPPLYMWLMKVLGIHDPYIETATTKINEANTNEVHVKVYQHHHGVGAGESDLYCPIEAFKGHTYIPGTTGAGKTKAFQMLIFQAAQLGAPIVVVDPKGDADLRDCCFKCALMRGGEDYFAYFDPFNPSISIRIDPLQNYTNATQIASRLTSLLPKGKDETFINFSWKAVNVVVNGLLASGEKVTLKSIKRYLQGDIAPLVTIAIKKYMANTKLLFPDFDMTFDRAEAKVNTLKNVDRDRFIAMELATYFEYKAVPKIKDKETYEEQAIVDMIAVLKTNQEYYQKIIQTILPLLEQLTSGTVGSLLSPDRDDPMDTSPVHTFSKMINQNKIVYINLSTLADTTVGSAIGSLFLAELTGVAAARTQMNISNPVYVYVDEAAETINEPFVQALNKGRSAGFVLTIASQTIADFTARVGNPAVAMKILGNLNNTIALRLEDDETKEYVSKKFGETSTTTIDVSKSSSTYSPSADMDFTTNKGTRHTTSDIPYVSEAALGELPNLHYFAQFRGGAKIKGRIFNIPIKKQDRFVEAIKIKELERERESAEAATREASEKSMY